MVDSRIVSAIFESFALGAGKLPRSSYNFAEGHHMQTQLRQRVRDMFVATNTGLYHGHVDGPTAELSPIGLEDQGTVLSVAIDVRDANIVYAATRRGGFFRSDDHGRTWHEKNNGLIYKEAW